MGPGRGSCSLMNFVGNVTTALMFCPDDTARNGNFLPVTAERLV